MKFGLYMNQYFHEAGGSVHAELAEQADVMEATGWDFMAFGERHLHPIGFQEQLTTMAWLAGRTRRLGICSAGFILPLYDPVMLAEQMANLDQLSDGRLIFGVVLGYQRDEFEMFGAELSKRVPLLEAGLETIARLWAGETLDGTNSQYPRPGARLSVLPAQKPRPPIWIGAIVPAAAIERAAVQADGWVASANASIPELAEKIALYKDVSRRAGTRGEVVVMRDGFVADSAAEARRIAADPMLGLYAEYAGWKRDSPDAGKYSTLTFESLEPKLIFGTPDDTVRQLQVYRDLGVDQIILRMQYPGLAQADILRCLRLFGEQVIPRVNAETPA